MNAKKIVVGVDGSAGSDAALAWAIDAASKSGAEVIAVHVVKPVAPRPFTASLRDEPPHRSDPRPRDAGDFVTALKTSRIKRRILTVKGYPAAEILRVADDEDADLVVVGNGLHSTMAEIFLGSVAHELTHQVRRPLAIVPASAPDTAINVLGKAVELVRPLKRRGRTSRS